MVSTPLEQPDTATALNIAVVALVLGKTTGDHDKEPITSEVDCQYNILKYKEFSGIWSPDEISGDLACR